MPSKVLAQILVQGRHDPAVYAAGALALDSLRLFVANDLEERQGVDVGRIFAEFPQRPDVLLICPRLVVGGGEKFSADVVGALVAAGCANSVVLVTDQKAADAPDLSESSILQPLRLSRIVFWPDVCEAYRSEVVLGRFLNAIRPKFTLVMNSRVGLEVVARYGRGLSRSSRIFCAYFGLGVRSLGAPYGAFFPRRTLPFATAITDNDATAAALRKRYGEIEGPGIAVLPPKVERIDDAAFSRRLSSKKRASRPAQWLWISRLEPFKGTAILSKLAELRPQERFDVYGPLQNDLEFLGLERTNIRYGGVVRDVYATDFPDYDGFIFTSLFEGMPNVVLEMAQQALPMVLSDVGGLRQTLDERAAIFVDVDSQQAAVNQFSRALDRVLSLSADDAEKMARSARQQVCDRHSPEIFSRNVSRIFGFP